jgi:hypothetical protein
MNACFAANAAAFNGFRVSVTSATNRFNLPTSSAGLLEVPISAPQPAK